MSNMRSKKRDEILGVFVEPEVKKLVKEAAKAKGLTMADYLRQLIKKDVRHDAPKGNENENKT